MNAPIAKLHDHLSETVIDDETVVMSLVTGDFYSLTGTAREIWQLVDGARDRDAIIADLASTYAVEPSSIAAEVDSFLSDLLEAGLVSS